MCSVKMTMKKQQNIVLFFSLDFSEIIDTVMRMQFHKPDDISIDTRNGCRKSKFVELGWRGQPRDYRRSCCLLVYRGTSACCPQLHLQHAQWSPQQPRHQLTTRHSNSCSWLGRKTLLTFSTNFWKKNIECLFKPSYEWWHDDVHIAKYSIMQ